MNQKKYGLNKRIATFLLVISICLVSTATVNVQTKLNQNDSVNNSIELLPKDSLIIKKLSSTLQEELMETNQLLTEIDKKLSPKGFVNKLTNSLPSNLIWEFIFKPLFLWVIGLIGSLSIISKIGIVIHIKNKQKRDETDKVAENANSIINGVSFVLLAFLIIVIMLIAFYQPNIANNNINPDIAERLSKIEELLTTFQGEQNNQKFNFNPLLLLISLSCLIGFSIMLYSRSTSSNSSIILHLKPSDSPQSIYNNEKFIIPVILSLILLILPYPVDSLILPFILSFYILALFELVKIYPNKVLLKIIIRRYSLIIFLAYFGVWRSFYYAIKIFADPLWTAFELALRENNHYDSISTMQLAWRYFPFLFAIFSALPNWKKVCNEISIDHISSLNEILDNQNNENDNK